MAKFGLLAFCWVSTLLTIAFNAYVVTYPSIHPQQCSWDCAANKRENELISSLSFSERIIYYTKRYLSDVEFQWIGNKNDTKVTSKDEVKDVHMLAFGDPQINGAYIMTSYLKKLDIWANDFYLGHIFRTMEKRLDPDYVAVMGDLFSSQWISDSEYFNRTTRYVERIFNRNTSYIRDIQGKNHDENGTYSVDWKAWGQKFDEKRKSPKPWHSFEYGYKDVHSWDPENEKYLFLNLTGNHDVGYSGDTTYQHKARFDQLFGKDNFWIEYDTDTDHPWRIVVLNSMLLEGPALQPEFVEATWEFLEQLDAKHFTGSTILLSHIPLYKEKGICSDGPYHDYYPSVYEKEPYKANLLRSQNHLNEDISNLILNIVFKNSQPGIILTGHDHVGCETAYTRDPELPDKWKATIPNKESQKKPHVQEITVRSMMGDFDGATGIVTGHFNKDTAQWQWSFTLCPFSRQHIWWAAKLFYAFTALLWSIYFV